MGVATCSACGGAGLALRSIRGDPLLGCPVHGRTMLDWGALLHIYHARPNQVFEIVHVGSVNAYKEMQLLNRLERQWRVC